jgi:hypothetical protein
VLNAKGGEIKAKANGSAPLENFENSRVRTFDLLELELLICQNTLIVSYCQKLVSYGENV